jgi:uroporphyrinogen decarboxylase
LNGDVLDHPPVALWRHFPVDDQKPKDLVEAIVDFQKAYDFDLVKVTPSSSYCLKDWGVLDEWRGASEGTREYTRRVVITPEDWVKLPILDPYQGYLADQLMCMKGIVAELDQTTPILQTIFNPLAQAKNLVGGEHLLSHIRKYPDEVHQGLQTITESTIRFVETAITTGISGIFFAVQHASYQLLSNVEYQTFGKYYDLQVLNATRALWLNMLHLHGNDINFEAFLDYPVSVINWHDQETRPSLGEAKNIFPGCVCGGLFRDKTMALGTPQQVLDEANNAVQETGGKRFILGTGCVMLVTTPRCNILAARRSVEV